MGEASVGEGAHFLEPLHQNQLQHAGVVTLWPYDSLRRSRCTRCILSKYFYFYYSPRYILRTKTPYRSKASPPLI